MTNGQDDRKADSPARPRRRWLSYSLRALFVLVLLAALPAWWIRSQLDAFAVEYEAMGRLAKLRAQLYTKPAEPQWFWKRFAGDTAGSRVTGAKEGRSPSPLPHRHARDVRLVRGVDVDECMKLVSQLKHLEQLYVEDEKLTDADLANCSGLRDLVSVRLDGCRLVTDKGLRHLRHAKNIEVLRLGSTSVGNGAVSLIARLDRLEELDLSGTQVDDREIGELTRCSRLRWLKLPVGVTSAGLAQLAPLNNITALWITANGRMPLAAFEKLEHLDVEIDSPDDGTTVAQATGLPKLKALYVRGEGVNDATLESLRSLDHLCHITVSRGRITPDGLRIMLRALHSVCQVILEDTKISREDVYKLQREFPAIDPTIPLTAGSYATPDPFAGEPPRWLAKPPDAPRRRRTAIGVRTSPPVGEDGAINGAPGATDARRDD